jgi:predicted HAD superfamily Cof-like phosphohydrolase
VTQFDLQAAVREFHDAFYFAVETEPTVPSEQIRYERARLIAEEAAELVSALLSGCPAWMTSAVRSVFLTRAVYRAEPADVATIAGELADLAYVTYGGAVNTGVPLAAVVAEVHRANMAKLGPDGRSIVDEYGKAQKPEGWTGPDVAGVLARGWVSTCRACPAGCRQCCGDQQDCECSDAPAHEAGPWTALNVPIEALD